MASGLARLTYPAVPSESGKCYVVLGVYNKIGLWRTPMNARLALQNWRSLDGAVSQGVCEGRQCIAIVVRAHGGPFPAPSSRARAAIDNQYHISLPSSSASRSVASCRLDGRREGEGQK